MGFLAGISDWIGRVVGALLIYPLGVFSLKMGHWERARGRLGWVIRHHPRHFGSHVHLGRLYLRLGNRIQALRLLNQARWIDPFRFERAELPREIHLTLGRDPMFSTHDLVLEPRAVSRSRSSARRDTGAEPAAAGLSLPEGDLEADEPDEAFRYGDFTSRNEYDRFRGLPPITPGDLSEVDWDRLLRRLHESD